MKLKGLRTTVDRIDVEVSERDICEAVRTIISRDYPKCSGDNELYDGRWQMFDGYNHHNGAPEYTKGEPATQDELIIEEFMKLLWKACKK